MAIPRVRISNPSLTHSCKQSPYFFFFCSFYFSFLPTYFLMLFVSFFFFFLFSIFIFTTRNQISFDTRRVEEYRASSNIYLYECLYGKIYTLTWMHCSNQQNFNTHVAPLWAQRPSHLSIFLRASIHYRKPILIVHFSFPICLIHSLSPITFIVCISYPLPGIFFPSHKKISVQITKQKKKTQLNTSIN